MKCSYKKFKLSLVPFIIYFLIINICMVPIPHAATNNGNENDFKLPKYRDMIEIMYNSIKKNKENFIQYNKYLIY